MPICINCSHPLPHLYTTYSKADDRSLGKGVRLTQCSNCKRFADKYVEHDYVVLFIDLVLIKPQVYRHLLFNRLNTGVASHNDSNSKTAAKTTTTTSTSHRYDRLDPSILRLGILLVLFDVYITWARVEKGTTTSAGDGTERGSGTPDNNDGFMNGGGGGGGGVLTNWPILGQYLFFLTLNLLSTVAQHGTIRMLARLFFSGPRMEERHANGDGGAGGGAGHSRTSSAATERPRDNQRGRDKDANTSPVVARKVVPSLSPHRHGQEFRSALGSPRTQNEHNAGNGSAYAEHAHTHAHTTSSSSPQRSPPSGSAISTALLVSSCTKLFPILLVIWPTTTGAGATEGGSGDSSATSSAMGPFGSRAASYIGWVVLFNNIEALMILLQPESGYLGVTALAVAGFVVRFLVEGCFFRAVSLASDGSGPVGDFLALVAWLRGRVTGL